MQHCDQRIQREPQHQRQHVGDLPAVARGRQQERQRRQHQDRGGKQLRQIGGKAVAERGRDQADREKAAAEPVRERDAPLARHLRQQPIALDPQRDRDEMRRQHQMTALGRRACAAVGSTDTTIGNSRIALTVDRDRGLHHRRPGAQRRDQDDLRRARPDQHRAAEHPAQAEMAVMGQRADAEIGRKQHQRQNRRRNRAHPPCEGAQRALPCHGVERRERHVQPAGGESWRA